jgi:transposase
VVDSASIEVNRRARRAKTDRLDSDRQAKGTRESDGRYAASEDPVLAAEQVPLLVAGFCLDLTGSVERTVRAQ